MPPVAEPHNLHVPAGRLATGPVGADLLVDLEAIAAQLGQGSAEPAQQPGVLGALVLRHDVTVGLEKHYDRSPPKGVTGGVGRTPPSFTTLASPAMKCARLPGNQPHPYLATTAGR